MSEQAAGNFISVSERLKQFKPASGRRTVKHYPTGIKKLDQMLGGGLYAGLTFLGARPGMGKSTFALQIASEIAAAGSPVLFYSLEMPSVRMEAKILNRAIHMRYPNKLPDRRLVFKGRKQYRKTERLEAGRKGGKRDQRQF